MLRMEPVGLVFAPCQRRQRWLWSHSQPSSISISRRVLLPLHQNNTEMKGLSCRVLPLLVLLTVMVCSIGHNLAEGAIAHSDTRGPVFAVEPPSRIDFSNSTGTRIQCSAIGAPQPDIKWVQRDGAEVMDVPNLRSLLPDGTMHLLPFRAEEYRQDIHAIVYRCVAFNIVGTIVSKEINVRGVVKQYYEVQVYDEYVIRGNTAVLRCHIPTFVRDYVRVTAWNIDEKNILPSTSDHRYTVTSTGELYIRQIEPSDGLFSYRCQAIHRLHNETQTSAPSKIIVTDPQSSVPPRITHSAQYITCKADSTAYLPCVSQGFPVPTYNWYRVQSKQLELISQSNTRYTQFRGMLIIHKAQLSDTGVYACIVNNSVGEERVEISVLITAPLLASIEPRQQVVDAGKTATKRCGVMGHPVNSVSWFKNGAPLNFDGRIRHSSRDVLEIEDVQREDAGMYQCFVDNEEESVQATSELKLGDAAPIFHSTFSEETYNPGPQVSLKCVASGNPPPNITWTLDGNPVSEIRRWLVGNYVTVTGEVVSYVNISRLKVEDGGEYACLAANRVGTVEYSARVNVYGLPYVRPFGNVTVVAGKVAEVTCRVAGYPIESISWERDGVPLPASLRQRIYPNGTLFIDRVERQSDQGKYVCIARSSQGQSARRNLWLVIVAPPKIDKFNFPQDLKEGMRTRISCIVSDGDLPLVLYWLRDGNPIQQDSSLQINSSDDFSSFITFRSLSSTHNGNYTCVASNGAATVSHTAELLVRVPPSWIQEPEDAEVLSNQQTILHCRAEGFPIPKIQWLRGRTDSPGDYTPFLPEDEDISVFANGSLFVPHATRNHQGYFLCQASNGIGSGLSKVVFLKVNVPAFFGFKSQNFTVEKHRDAILRCDAKGETPIGITWMKNKEKINFRTEDRLNYKEFATDDGMTSELIIKDAELGDAAYYGCLATNAFGHDEVTFQVIVQERPGPPANLKIPEVSSKYIKLTWNQGKSGNSVISKYIVKYTMITDDGNVSTPFTSDVSDTTAIITSLTPGTTYKFWVIAVNNIGESLPSETVEVTCAEETPEGSPLAVEAKAVGPDSIHVTWLPPKKELWNGQILGYYIGYKIYDNPEPYVYKTLRVSSGFREEIYLSGLRKFTKYSIVVQAFNRMGSGLDSDEVVAYTLEDVPSAPPQHVQCSTQTSQGIHVTWLSPPPASQNGAIRGYKILYSAVDDEEGPEDTKAEVITSQTMKANLRNLSKYTNYTIRALAFTRVGDGAISGAVYCRTNEDVPGPPADIKALVMSSEAIIVTWKPSEHPNGIILKYTVYMRLAEAGDHHIVKHIMSSDPSLTFEARGLKDGQRYEFWVTASTVMGEGESTKVVSQSPKTRVPANISSFSDRVVVPYKETVRLPCRAVGIPTPSREWKKGGRVIEDDERTGIGQDGALILQNIQNTDTGNYSCQVTNAFGSDTIFYAVSVKAPPISPSIIVAQVTISSITVSWKDSEDGGSRILGYYLSFKRDFGEWEEIEIRPDQHTFTLSKLHCGSRYQLYLTAFNRMGTGQPSGIIPANTEGSAPQVAKKEDVLEPNSTFIQLRLDRWPDGGCRILYFVVQYKLKQNVQWTLVSNNIQSYQIHFIITDLQPSSWYSVQITAHNDAGSVVAEYDFRTITNIGDGFDWTQEWGGHESAVEPAHFNFGVIVPVTGSAASVFMGFLALCCFFMRRKHRGFQQTENELPYATAANKAVLLDGKASNHVQLNHDGNCTLSYAALTPTVDNFVATDFDAKSTKSSKSVVTKNKPEVGYQDSVAPYATCSLPNLHDSNDANNAHMKTFYEKQLHLSKEAVAAALQDMTALLQKHQQTPQHHAQYAESVILSPSHFSKAENHYHSPNIYHQANAKDYTGEGRYRVNPTNDYSVLNRNGNATSNDMYEQYRISQLDQQTQKVPDVIYNTTDTSSSNDSIVEEERHLRRSSRNRYSHFPKLPLMANELIGPDSQEFSAAECDRDIIIQYRKETTQFVHADIGKIKSRSIAHIDDEEYDEDDEDDGDDDEDRVHLRMSVHGYDHDGGTWRDGW